MNDLHTPAPSDPAMFEPLTADENHILHAHLSSIWLKHLSSGRLTQEVVYPPLSEPWHDTRALLGLYQAHRAASGAGREPEAGQ